MASSHELVAKIESEARVLNIVRWVIVVIIIGLLAFLSVQSIVTENQLKESLKVQQTRERAGQAETNQIIAQLKQQSDTQTAYIRCIAEFFAQPNRTNLTLADLDNCNIVAAGGTPPTNTTSSQSPQAASTAKPVSQTAPSPSPSPKTSKEPPGQANLFQRIVKLVNGIPGL